MQQLYSTVNMKALTFTVALVGIVAAAQADTLRSQIEAMNKTVGASMMKRDIGGFVKACKGGMTKDFKYVEAGKSESFDKMAEGVKMGFSQMAKVSVAKSKILSLTEKGNKATALTEHTMAYSSVPGPDKKSHTVTMVGTSTDTYVKVGSRWMMSSMTWGSQKMTMDGKPMDMSKMGG
jgi:hypothetical protein